MTHCYSRRQHAKGQLLFGGSSVSRLHNKTCAAATHKVYGCGMALGCALLLGGARPLTASCAVPLDTPRTPARSWGQSEVLLKEKTWRRVEEVTDLQVARQPSQEPHTGEHVLKHREYGKNEGLQQMWARERRLVPARGFQCQKP